MDKIKKRTQNITLNERVGPLGKRTILIFVEVTDSENAIR
jgi:hypothetical protein